MKKNLLFFLLDLILLTSSGKGQEIQYFQPFDTISSDSYFYPVGNINNKYLVLKLFATEQPALLIFNDSGRQVAERTIPVPELRNTVIPRILVTADSWTLVFQHLEKDLLYLAIARLNENGDLLQPYTRLDSSRVNKLGNSAYYSFAVSADKKKIILHRMILGLQPDKILVDFFAITSDGKETEKSSHYIPFRKELQEITPLFQHTNGRSYFATFDKADNTKLSATTIIYQFAVGAKDLFVKEINFTAAEPVKPVFVSNTLSNELIFASLYHEQYSAGIKGILISKINLERIAEDASTTIIPFTKTKNGEWNIGKGTARLGYKESRGDLLEIINCAMLGQGGNLTILLENRYTFSQRNTQSVQSDFPGQHNNSITILGRQNITPSQDFDLLRNHLSGIGTSNEQRPGNGHIFVGNLGIAPVSTWQISGGDFSELLSEQHTYHVQAIPNNSGSNSATRAIQQEHVELQLDKYYKPLRKGKLAVNYPPATPIVSGYIAGQHELAILNYIPGSNYRFTLELFDGANPPYQALLSSKNGYKLFYGETFGYGSEKKVLTLFSTADDKKIGLAIISW